MYVLHDTVNTEFNNMRSGNASVFLQNPAPSNVRTSSFDTKYPRVSSKILRILTLSICQLCARFFHWQNTGASLQVITTHGLYHILLSIVSSRLIRHTVILSTRLYAMYKCSRKVLASLILLLVAEMVMLGLVLGKPPPNAIGKLNSTAETPGFIFKCMYAVGYFYWYFFRY